MNPCNQCVAERNICVPCLERLYNGDGVRHLICAHCSIRNKITPELEIKLVLKMLSCGACGKTLMEGVK